MNTYMHIYSSYIQSRIPKYNNPEFCATIHWKKEIIAMAEFAFKYAFERVQTIETGSLLETYA